MSEERLVNRDRRHFLKRWVGGAGAAVLGAEATSEIVFGAEGALGVGFRNDAQGPLDRFARPAAYAVPAKGGLVECVLCPHACILGENDRGFCRSRVVKDGRLHTVAYGNLCSYTVDPIEKKPFYHYLPSTRILSVAMGGCNLRCQNCQNWTISQARPAEVFQRAVFPEALASSAASSRIPSIAYTYSEPLVSFEYVRDAAAAARDLGVRNALVTAGFINPKPLRELCRVIDAVTLDVKAFRDSFYREVSGARLPPVLRALEILREEKVWVEVSFLMVPTLSDDPAEIGQFAAWMAKTLGEATPLHILRFHPAHRLKNLPPTGTQAMTEARRRATDAGLRFVYLGNVPEEGTSDTRCPRDGRVLVERRGFHVLRNDLVNGHCPCGEPIPGVFS